MQGALRIISGGVGDTPNLAGASNPSPFTDYAQVSENVRLDIQAIKTLHGFGWVNAVKG